MSNDEQSSGAGTEPGKPEPKHPFTLAVDIGGTGLKASVLGAAGLMVADRVKVATTYPLPPEKLVTVLTKLVAPLPQAERASVGFPGMVRDGKILSAPHFSTKSGPGSAVDPDLAKQWDDFDLASALSSSFGLPTKVANDADIQGAAVISGEGLELTITLGTGFGTGLFYNGQMLPHLEVAHQPFRKGETYNDQLGEPAGPHVLRPPLHRRGQLPPGEPESPGRRRDHRRQHGRHPRRDQALGHRPHRRERRP
jgi:polyphosphate glucokinase